MIFATFFSYDGKIPRLELELLKTFQRSLNAQYANARLVILTDSLSASQFRALGFDPYPIPVKRGTLLLDRVRGLRSLLDALDDGTRCVMLDFDMLVMKPFDFLDLEFEVAYTVRQHLNKQPLNGGVAIYRATRSSKRILDQVIEDYQSLPPEQQQWWGDQTSISNLFKEKLGNLSEGMNYFDEAWVLLLDARKYNFTPYDMDVSPKTLAKNFVIDGPLAQWLDEPLEEKYILHFKGPRKHLQFQVSWQIDHRAEYKKHLRNEFLRQIPYFQSKRESHLAHLAESHPNLWEVNDFCVLALLNYAKIFGDSDLSTRSSLLTHLKLVGDFRANILGNVPYKTTKL